MKKIIYLFVFLLSLSMVSGLDISLENYDPKPVEPGKSFEVEFLVYNELGESVEVEFELSGDDMFDFSDTSDVEITLDAGEEETISFFVRVDADVSEEDGILELEYEIDGDKEVEEFLVLIDTSAYLSVKEVDADSFNIGEEDYVKITVENSGVGVLNDVEVSLDLSEVPFAFVDGVGYEVISSLDGGETETIKFKLLALNDAEQGVYKVPFNIIYDGVEKETELSLEVVVFPELEVIIEDSFGIIGEVSEIKVSLVNKGLGDLKFLDIKLLDMNWYDVIGNDKVYVGDVDKEDYETVEFNLVTEKDDVTLFFLIEYKDVDHSEFSEVYEVSLDSYTREDAEGFGLVESSTVSYWVYLIVILVIGYIVYKVRKRKRR